MIPPGHWQTAYDFPALRAGRVVKETFPTALPKASSFFVFNTRRPIFSDIRVREAIALLFDFEWANHNLFFDLYRRTASYFEGSELSARLLPRARELSAGFHAPLVRLSSLVRQSTMFGNIDFETMRLAIRRIDAALRLRRLMSSGCMRITSRRSWPR